MFLLTSYFSFYITLCTIGTFAIPPQGNMHFFLLSFFTFGDITRSVFGDFIELVDRMKSQKVRVFSPNDDLS